MAGRFILFMHVVGVESFSVICILNGHERVCVWPPGG
jgi:hypothetical protein